MLRTPSRVVSNYDVLQYIREINTDLPGEHIEAYCRKIERLFEKAGSETRYIRDREAGERAFDLLTDAAQSAIAAADLRPTDIDLIIYCGVGRGFLEPSNAMFLACALNMSCDGFDIAEACMSWVRALQIAQGYLCGGTYTKILIVNAEFSVFENGYPDALRLRPDDEVLYSFAALTVGEAATAVVVTPSEQPWDFRFRTKPKFAPLCSLPLPGYAGFCAPDDKIGINGPHQFAAYSAELTKVAVREMTKFVRDVFKNPEDVDIWFPHSSSENALKKISADLNLNNRLYLGIFRKFGNLASASIPAAIYTAEQDGQLKRGQRMVFCPASAGMVFGLVRGIY
jgi:3-oxoacyl-[acyl-carrier-protein] synthase III